MNPRDERSYYSIADKKLNLRIGARVIATANNPTAGYYNGSLGTVTNCDEDGPSIKFDSKTKSIKVKNVPWKNGASPGTEIPLELAFAITIHKAQGQTFDNLVLDLTDGLFARG